MDLSESTARAVLGRLGKFLDRFAGCFGRRAQRDGASRYIQGLLNDSERKSMQPMEARLPARDSASYQRAQPFIHSFAVVDNEALGPLAGGAAGPHGTVARRRDLISQTRRSLGRRGAP